MNVKIFIRIFIILIIINILFLPKIQASTIKEMYQSSSNFIRDANQVDTTINTAQLKTTSNFIYRTLLSIAIIISVVVGAILGVNFILASADGKAKISEALIPYVIGLVIVFGAFAIWKIVVSIGNDAETKLSVTTEYKESFRA